MSWVPHFSTDELNFARVLEGAFVALSTGLSALAVGYSRLNNKRSKRIEEHTQTSVRVDGNLHVKSAADTAEEALEQSRTNRQEITLLREELWGPERTITTQPRKPKHAPTGSYYLPAFTTHVEGDNERSDSSNPDADASSVD